MITEPLKLEPEYSIANYHYKAPNGTLWNVSWYTATIVYLWTVNAWGQMYTENINRIVFINTYKEI